MSHTPTTRTDTAPTLDLERLVGTLDDLPRKQRQLAEVLLQKPEVFAFGTLDTIENLLDVSGITIIRFSKRLGFGGFQSLQAEVRRTYLERSGFSLRAPDLTPPGEGGPSYLEATVAQLRSNVQSALDNLPIDEIGNVVDAILGAERVLACGAGSAAVVAQLLIRLLRHAGLRGELVDAAAVDGIIAVQDVRPGDVVIGVGFWLSFADVTRVMRLARRRGATTVALIGSPVSPMSALADYTLHAPAQGAALSFSASGPIAVVECLIAALADRCPERVAAIRERLHEAYVEEDLIVSRARGASDDISE